MTSQNSWQSWFVVAICSGLLSSHAWIFCDAHAQEGGGEEYTYVAAGKRDPFFPPFRMVESEAEATNEPRTPLQRFDIGQLKLVGVIWESDEPRALVEDSGGLGYIVTRGTLIGSRGGIVKTIEPKRIIIEEYQTDFFGKRQAQEKEMRLVVTETSQRDKKPAR